MTPPSPITHRSTCGAAMACTAARTPRSAPSSRRWPARATRPGATAARRALRTTWRSPTIPPCTFGAATASTAARTPASAPCSSRTCRWMASATRPCATAARRVRRTTRCSRTTRPSMCGGAMVSTGARTPRSASSTPPWMAAGRIGAPARRPLAARPARRPAPATTPPPHTPAKNA